MQVGLSKGERGALQGTGKIAIGIATKILAPSYPSLFLRLVTLEMPSERRAIRLLLGRAIRAQDLYPVPLEAPCFLAKRAQDSVRRPGTGAL